MISSVITKHSAALEQLYQNLYPHPVEDLILKENITDSYRFFVTHVNMNIVGNWMSFKMV